MRIINQDLRKLRRKTYLWLRGCLKSSHPNRPINIYHAAVQKTGSQWLKAILSDPIVTNETGLLTYPQHRYEFSEFHRRFPRLTFVPGLYMSYELYEEIDKPAQYRTIYVLRDPRDIIVSWYHSMLKTHVLMGKVGKYRERLQQLHYEDGVSFCIDALQIRFAHQRSWAFNSGDDPKVLVVKYEDLVEHSVAEFSRLFAHCAVNLDRAAIHRLVEKHSFHNMRRRDMESQRGRGESHYRAGKSGGWRQALSDRHLAKFYAATGDLVEVLGYARV